MDSNRTGINPVHRTEDISPGTLETHYGAQRQMLLQMTRGMSHNVTEEGTDRIMASDWPRGSRIVLPYNSVHSVRRMWQVRVGSVLPSR